MLKIIKKNGYKPVTKSNHLNSWITMTTQANNVHTEPPFQIKKDDFTSGAAKIAHFRASKNIQYMKRKRRENVPNTSKIT